MCTWFRNGKHFKKVVRQHFRLTSLRFSSLWDFAPQVLATLADQTPPFVSTKWDGCFLLGMYFSEAGVCSALGDVRTKVGSFLQEWRPLGSACIGLLPGTSKQMWCMCFGFIVVFSGRVSSNHKLVYCHQKQKSGGNHFNHCCYFPSVASPRDNLVVTGPCGRAPGLFICSFRH